MHHVHGRHAVHDLQILLMAKSKKAQTLPTPEARGKLLQVVRSNVEPLPAAALAKQVPPPDQVSAAIAVSYLDAAVASGELFFYPPKTARGKPRYWDRDLAALTQQAVSQAALQFAQPFTVKDIVKYLKGLATPIKLTDADVLPVLNNAMAAGSLFPIPAATTKSQPRYWHKDVTEFGRQLLEMLVERKGPQPQAALVKALKGFHQEQINSVLQSALGQRVLWRHPACGKIKKELLGLSPPSPALYLKEIGPLLSKVVGVLLHADVPPAAVRRSLVEMIEATGISLGSTSGPAAAQVSASAPVAPDLPARESGNDERRLGVDLISLIRKIEPGADRGALVGASELRRVARLEKQVFDRAILELARNQRLTLHRHDYPASLSEHAREELVFDGTNTYYVGFALVSE